MKEKLNAFESRWLKLTVKYNLCVLWDERMEKIMYKTLKCQRNIIIIKTHTHTHNIEYWTLRIPKRNPESSYIYVKLIKMKNQ